MAGRRRFAPALLGPVLAVAILAGGALPGAARGAEIEDRASRFIAALAVDAVESLTRPDTPREVRIQRFRRMFNQHFAVEAIGKFVLGRHWRDATEAERTEYLALFEDLMVVSYVDRFQRYAGENLKILRTVADNPKTAVVFSDIERPGAAKPIRILWRVGAKGETLKILDVLVKGASMSLTLRSDFASILQQRDGLVSGLLEALRAKTQSLKSAPGG